MATKKKVKKVKKIKKTYEDGIKDAANFVLGIFMNELFTTDTPRTALSPSSMDEKCRYVARRVKKEFKC